jgi:hypothetical protein
VQPLGDLGVRQPPGDFAQYLTGGVDVLAEVEGGEDEDLDIGGLVVLLDLPGGFDPVLDRHADVHEHDVGTEPAGQGDRLGAVIGLAENLHVGGDVDENPACGRWVAARWDNQVRSSVRGMNHDLRRPAWTHPFWRGVARQAAPRDCPPGFVVLTGLSPPAAQLLG